MAIKNSVKAIRILSANSAGLLPAVWQEVTPAKGLANSLFMLFFRNESNRTIGVSYDGANMHEVIPANGDVTLNVQQNSQPNNFTAVFPKGTHIYLSAAAGGVGFIYLGGFYQEEQ
jgi:hypothetical protein